MGVLQNCNTPKAISLAAAAVVAATVVAADVVAATVAIAIATAVAEQEQKDDDPANVTAAETVIIHDNTSGIYRMEQLCRSFQDIPQRKNGA